MPGLSSPDFVALVFFLIAWLGYSRIIAGGRGDKRGLNHLMEEYRVAWMREMASREQRAVSSS